MRRLFLAVVAILVTVAASAQHTGIVGGITSSTASFRHIDNDSFRQFHVGITSSFPLLAGFSIQPELLYNRKGDMGYSEFLDLGVQLQLDILPGQGRLYALVEPYLEQCLDDGWHDLNNVEGGFALGAGIQLINCLQLSAKYYWNLGHFHDAGARVSDGVSRLFNDGTGFDGLSLSLVYFFNGPRRW